MPQNQKELAEQLIKRNQRLQDELKRINQELWVNFIKPELEKKKRS